MKTTDIGGHQFWTVQEAAETLRVSKKTILERINKRTIQATMPADRWLIPRIEIVRLLDQNSNTRKGIINE